MPKVPERKLSDRELKQKAKVVTKVCRSDKQYNSWGTPKNKQGMFKKKKKLKTEDPNLFREQYNQLNHLRSIVD